MKMKNRASKKWVKADAREGRPIAWTGSEEDAYIFTMPYVGEAPGKGATEEENADYAARKTAYDKRYGELLALARANNCDMKG